MVQNARIGFVVILLLILSFHASAEVVEIEYWRVSSHPYEDLIIDRFNQLYEGRIRVVGIPGHSEEELVIAVIAGTPPALSRVDRFRVGSFASQGYLRPLDDLLARDGVLPDAFFTPTWDEVVYQGRPYAMPRNTDNRALWYNKTLFEAAGLDSAQPPRTWYEADEYARRLDRWDGDRFAQIGFVPHGGDFGFPGWLWAAGGDLLDATNREVAWNSPAGLAALSWMGDRLTHYGGNSAIAAFNAQFPGGPLVGGGVAMEMGRSGQIGSIREAGAQWEWGVAPPPRPEGLEHTPVTWSGGHAFAIPVGAEHVDEAWEFIKFYTTDHWAQLQLGLVGHMPVRLQTAISSDYREMVDPLMQQFVELMPYSMFRPVVPVGDELFAIYRDEVLNQLVSGEVPPEQILSETARRAQILLAEAWANVAE